MTNFVLLIFLWFGVSFSLDSNHPVSMIVIHVKPSATNISLLLKSLDSYAPDQVEVVRARRNGTISLLASEKHKDGVLKMAQKMNIHSKDIIVTRIEDIEIEHGWSHPKSRSKKSIDEFKLEAYNTFESIREYLGMLANDFPHICQTEVIGHTFENNEVIVVKLHGRNAAKPRAKIFIDGTQHAREWISPAVLIYIINKLITGYDTGDEWVVDVLEKYEFHIIPVVNPDGYAFTHNVSGNRFWRKNRNDNGGETSCIGVDLNRNWGFHWSGRGGSSYTCSNIYYGAAQFSEAETLALSEYIRRYNGTWHSYFSFHSYGQLILFPWSHSADQSPDYTHHLAAGRKMAEGIKQTFNSTVYTVGSVGRLLYAASGSSESWAYGSGTFPYSYTLELPNLYHFVIPKELIAPTALEIIGGLKSYLSYIEETRPELINEILETSQRYLENSTTTVRQASLSTSITPQGSSTKSTVSHPWTTASTQNATTQGSASTPQGLTQGSVSTPQGLTQGSASTPQGLTQGSVSTPQGLTQGSVSTPQGLTQGSVSTPQGLTQGSISTPTESNAQNQSSISTKESNLNETIWTHVTKETGKPTNLPLTSTPKCHGKCLPLPNLQLEMVYNLNSATHLRTNFTYLFYLLLIIYNIL